MVSSPPAIQYVLVTGATGFIGAHVVDQLLSRGIKVRGATRSLSKGKAMIDVRPEFREKLDFVQIGDFENPGGFLEAIQDIDAVIHVASPFTYDTKDNEKELIIPAINGVDSILKAAATSPKVKRIVITSSFASVLDAGRKAPPYFTYTGDDWNPLSYEESVDPETSAVIAYRGSKKFAELKAWDFIAKEKPSFDLVTLCPPMTFGPIRHPVTNVDTLNESNKMLFNIASGETPLPVARVPFWIDVRDLAKAHVEALLRPEAGGKRYIPASPERFTYSKAASIIGSHFAWAADNVSKEVQAPDESHGVDGETAGRELGLDYIPFTRTVIDLITQQHLTALSSRNHSQPASRVNLSQGATSNASDGSPISAPANGTQAIDDEPPQFSSSMREPLDVASEPMNIPAEHKTSSSYLLGLPAVKMLVGEYPTNLFFLLESQSPLPPELSPEQSQNPLPPFQIERSVLDHLVATFFSSVHVSHPVLDQAEFTEIYERFLDKGADSSTESALCMTVFALGAVSSLPIGLCHPQTSPNGTKYMKYALPTLMLRSLWLFSFDLTLAQALVLASVYFAYILKLSSLDCQKQTLNTEVDILRLFWSCFIIECDRLAELELPRSSLQQLTDDASLPRCGNLDDLHMTAYLAEISIRRLLNRIHNSLYPRTPNSLNTSLSSTSLMTPEEFSIDELTSITSVCEELHSQLDLWHAAIPEQFRPPLNLEEIDNDRISILRIRYYAAKHIIYRPFVLHVTTHTSSQISSAIVEKAGICIESCSVYLYHTSKILRAPSQYTWTFALS
ncbi:NAD-dependent epimerase/dehydratase [Fusarium oxysporum f. sp. vasinfectum]|nr:NAD-dependent epimerase/dehydratase [Fusarium oxysporum f. sp. vasinfectum]